MTRAASLVLRVLGLALVLVGLMGFVLLGADGTWTARTQIPAGHSAVLLEPAVVSVLGPRVAVQVEPVGGSDAGAAPGDGSTLFLGRGRSDDLASYARDLDVARVVGLERSRTLDVRVAHESRTTTPSPLRVPSTVDLWQQQVSGRGTDVLRWRPTPGAQSVLVAHQDGTPLPALDVAVSWTDHTWLWIPFAALVLGLGLLAVGLVAGGVVPALRLAAPDATRRPGLEGAERRRPSRIRRPAPSPSADLGAGPPPVTVAPVGVSALPVPEPALTHPAPTAVAPAETVLRGGAVLPSRRAARGRRRKQTLWDRAVSRARSAAPAVTGARRSGSAGRSEAEHGERDGDRS